MDIAERASFVSRDVKRFLIDFDASIEYQYEADPFVKCHPSWVSSEADLTEDGLALRKFLLANPEQVDA